VSLCAIDHKLISRHDQGAAITRQQGGEASIHGR
jgi:hypothetical protein